MLLNAFCGHSRRRMYARIKWGDNNNIRACELLCEFFNDSKTSSRRLANIQLFCLQNIDIKQQQHLFIKNKNLVFTTRHNSFCSIIYLDSK
uniref:Candidate secreted effector n=1 Tax=Meloidogyne incognita TaxID=6306 RepID=A0A914LGX1_MELIC